MPSHLQPAYRKTGRGSVLLRPTINKPVPILYCPSDPLINLIANSTGDGTRRASIAISFGDCGSLDNNYRGIVGNTNLTWRPEVRSFGSITDGTSNTILCSEVVSTDVNTSSKVKGGTHFANTALQSGSDLAVSVCMNARSTSDRTMLNDPIANNSWRGVRQFDSPPAYQTFCTIIPPNGPCCARVNGDTQWGIRPPQSHHTGGVNGGYVDGSVHFIPDSVDTGGLPNAPLAPTGASKFGAWGALGSINGEESVSLP